MTNNHDESTPRAMRRERRENFPGGRSHVHKVKVSPEEEARLLTLARERRLTVVRLLVESALAEEVGMTASERRETMIELFALHRLLGAISNNVNQIAKAANATGGLRSDTRATLAKVRETAQRIDSAIEGLSLS